MSEETKLCSTCRRPMNEGEAKVFTVCDACWDDIYRGANANGDRIREDERLKMFQRDRDAARADLKRAVAERERLVTAIEAFREAAMRPWKGSVHMNQATCVCNGCRIKRAWWPVSEILNPTADARDLDTRSGT